jgi:hypothetical protein
VLLRFFVGDALWKVSKDADDYDYGMVVRSDQTAKRSEGKPKWRPEVEHVR